MIKIRAKTESISKTSPELSHFLVFAPKLLFTIFKKFFHLTWLGTMNMVTLWRDAASPWPCMVHASPYAVWNQATTNHHTVQPCYGDGNRARHDDADCIGTMHHQDGNVRSRGRRRWRHDDHRRLWRHHNVGYSKTMVENFVRTLENFLELKMD